MNDPENPEKKTRKSRKPARWAVAQPRSVDEQSGGDATPVLDLSDPGHFTSKLDAENEARHRAETRPGSVWIAVQLGEAFQTTVQEVRKTGAVDVPLPGA